MVELLVAVLVAAAVMFCQIKHAVCLMARKYELLVARDVRSRAALIGLVYTGRAAPREWTESTGTEEGK